MSKKFRLTLITGVMKTGKTDLLLTLLEEAKKENKITCLVKPAFDNRFGVQLVKSRTGKQAEADFICNQDVPDEIIWLFNKEPFNVLFVDECQFFNENFPFVIDFLLKRNVKVILSGLLRDSENRFFGSYYKMLERNHVLLECSIACTKCNNDATRSFRLSSDKTQLLLGDTEYEPRCEDHCF